MSKKMFRRPNKHYRNIDMSSGPKKLTKHWPNPHYQTKILYIFVNVWTPRSQIELPPCVLKLVFTNQPLPLCRAQWLMTCCLNFHVEEQFFCCQMSCCWEQNFVKYNANSYKFPNFYANNHKKGYSRSKGLCATRPFTYV